jgi:hypothetical protein
MSRLLVFIFCVLVVTGVVAQSGVRKYANSFLDIGVGARGLGMSNACVAGTDDVYASYYNPAGLVNIEQTFQVGLMHSEYFAGIAKYDHGSVAVPIQDGKRVLGFSFFRFGIDDIPNTLFLYGPDGTADYSRISNFSSADYAFNLHYAQKFDRVEGLSFGGSAKIVYRTLGPFGHATGFGIDLGLQYRKDGWRAGAMLRDITTTFAAWDFGGISDSIKRAFVNTGQDLPKNSIEYKSPTIIFGGGYEVNIKDKFYIYPELNLIFTTDGQRNVLVPGKPISMDLGFGVEMNYAKIGYIRAGIGNMQRYVNFDGKTRFTAAPTLGAGLHIKFISVDYTLANLAGLSGTNAGLYSHVISIRLDINTKAKQGN